MLKNYSNFQLKNSDSAKVGVSTYKLNGHGLNAQQIIKLDDLSSTGTKIRIYDDSAPVTNTIPRYGYTDFNMSVKMRQLMIMLTTHTMRAL